MKDLYTQLGVSDSAGEAEIREALTSAGEAGEAREAAEFILLDPTRRAVYDRNRRVLLTVGRLRANLGLNLTRFWPRSRFADFTVDLNPLPRGGERRPVDSMNMAWAFGVEPPGVGRFRRGRRKMIVVAAAAVTVAALILALWYWMAAR
jgi:hypothetical protein